MPGLCDAFSQLSFAARTTHSDYLIGSREAPSAANARDEDRLLTADSASVQERHGGTL
jgi:hypothetical protein